MIFLLLVVGCWLLVVVAVVYLVGMKLLCTDNSSVGFHSRAVSAGAPFLRDGHLASF